MGLSRSVAPMKVSRGSLPTADEAVLAARTEQRLEGLIAKRVDSAYRSGIRSKDRLKITNRIAARLVTDGFAEGTRARTSAWIRPDAVAVIEFAGCTNRALALDASRVVVEEAP